MEEKYESNNDSYTTNAEERENKPKKLDHATEAKSKVIFFIIVVVVMIAAKYLFKL